MAQKVLTQVIGTNLHDKFHTLYFNMCGHLKSGFEWLMASTIPEVSNAEERSRMQEIANIRMISGASQDRCDLRCQFTLSDTQNADGKAPVILEQHLKRCNRKTCLGLHSQPLAYHADATQIPLTSCYCQDVLDQRCYGMCHRCCCLRTSR